MTLFAASAAAVVARDCEEPEEGDPGERNSRARGKAVVRWRTGQGTSVTSPNDSRSDRSSFGRVYLTASCRVGVQAEMRETDFGPAQPVILASTSLSRSPISVSAFCV